MSAKLIDGKTLADQIMINVRKEIVENNLHPGLAVFLVGDDEASKIYVKLKEKACQKVGINFHKYYCDDNLGQQEILNAIDFLNQDQATNAILVQLPLPKRFDTEAIINQINPAKDVDGFHPQTMNTFLEGKNDFIPGLSMGIIRLIESTKQNLDGKTAVIVAKSDIFSKPLIKLLQNKNVATTTIKPEASNLQETTINADILIVAVGRPDFITEDMVKQDTIIIDVGTNKEGGMVVGDVDFENVKQKAGYITPVPGGVGPVTVAMLLENTVKLTKKQIAE